MYDSIYPPDYYILEHHGILGQKWGVRRYQNSDGSLTPAGRSRYITTNKHAIDWATYKIGSDKVESKMGRHATLRSMTNLNMRRQAAREVGEGLSARDKASGMYRVYNRRKIANGVAAGLGVVGTAAGIASNPAVGAALGVRTGLAAARSHYNNYKAEIAASGHTENLENVHAAQLVDMYNKTTGRKQSSAARALDIGAVGIGRFDSRHPAVGVAATVATAAAVGAAASYAGGTSLNLIPSPSSLNGVPSPSSLKGVPSPAVKWPDLNGVTATSKPAPKPKIVDLNDDVAPAVRPGGYGHVKHPVAFSKKAPSYTERYGFRH